MDTTSTLPRPTGPAPIGEPPNTNSSSTRAPGRLTRLWSGPTEDPSWARPSLIALLLATGVLYLWGLGASDWANPFYSAAAQAGSESWKAFFFGSSDSASSITVDKTPLALWPMALSVRLFGLSSWSILVPQALEGISTVALLHHLVRRTTGSASAGLIAGAVMALTPVAVLMFRFNNPDALLTLLLVGAAAATLRGVEATRVRPGVVGHPVRWLALAGALVGLAFLTKMLQAFLVLPALALVYLLCANTSWGKRIGHLLVAFGSMLLAGGWWIAIVELWPASSRPYIGGSQTNSILELTLGYNGLGRLSGNETGSVGGGGAGGGAGGGWGATGVMRLFNSEIGGQIAWLLPAAFVLGIAALWFGRRQVNLRAGLVLWGTWLLVTALTFSFMAGIFHPYYTVALAPAVAALVGIGVVGALAAPQLPGGHRGALLHCGDELGARVVPAGPDHRLPALAEVGRRGRRPAVRTGSRRCRPPSPQAGPGRRGNRPGGDARRAGGIRDQHGGHATHRLDPECRPGNGRHPRRPRRWTRRDARWCARRDPGRWPERVSRRGRPRVRPRPPAAPEEAWAACSTAAARAPR